VFGSSRLLNYAQDSYLERTSRPIYAVLFLLPFILFYEYGTITINTDTLHQSQIRVVAFVWLQNFLESVGFGGKLALAAPPLAVIVILLSLQITSRKQWTFWTYDYGLMIVECILLAIPLIVLTLFLSSVGTRYFHKQPDSNAVAQTWSVPACTSGDNIYTLSSSNSAGNNNKTSKPHAQRVALTLTLESRFWSR